MLALPSTPFLKDENGKGLKGEGHCQNLFDATLFHTFGHNLRTINQKGESIHFGKVFSLEFQIRAIAKAHDQKPWTPVLGLVLMLPRMSTKKPRCLTTMGDLPHSCFKSLLGYSRTDLSMYKEAHIRRILQKWNASCLLHMFERFNAWNAWWTASHQRWTQKQKVTSLIWTWNHSTGRLLSWHLGQPENQP